MLRLCGFADEISPDLDEQIWVCRECGVRLIELRSVNGINVLDFDSQLRNLIKSRLRDSGMAVACIGSPIGKVPISEPWEKHFDRFRIAVASAEFFGARMIRLFSYYPADLQDDIRRHRDEVLRRMAAKLDYLGDRDIVLLHENESRIYGERLAECVDLMQSIESPRFRFAFDFANFIVAGDRPSDNWPVLKPFVAHFHIKDARLSDRAIVPSGEGDGQIGSILSDAYRSGYRGLLSLEPHLSAAGQFSGFSGPQLFRSAVDALRGVCESADLPLDGSANA